MRRSCLSLSLAIALVPFAASGEDLLQAYRQARTSDPQLAAAEAGNRATRENAVQARATMLPQVSGSATANASRTKSDSGDTVTTDPVTGALQPIDTPRTDQEQGGNLGTAQNPSAAANINHTGATL